MTWWKEFEVSLFKGRNEEILLILKKVAIKDAHDRDGNNLLHYLANSRTDNEDLAAFLIESGCKVNEKNKENDTPLLIATQFKCEKIIKLLLKAGANCHDVNRLGFTPLELLIRMKDLENVNIQIAKLLIQSGSNVNLRTSLNESLLHLCVNHDDADWVDLILKAGAKVDAVDEFNQTPLFFATYRDYYRIAQRLIQAGADVNWSDDDGSTCLFHAAHFLHPRLVKLLLENGADVHKLDDDQRTPLHYCLYEIGNFILHLNFSSTIVIGNGRKLDDHFITIDSPGMVDKLVQCLRLLIKNGADINFLSNGKTPLGLAILYHHSKITQFLLDHGAVFNYDNPWDDDALHRAYNPKAAQELLRWTAMRKIQGTNNEIMNFNIKKLKTECYKDFYKRCEIELKNMQVSLIHGSTSYFDVLVDEKINSYTRNLKFIDEFKENLIFKRFPIYGDLLGRRIQKALRKQDILNKAIEGLSRVTKFNESFHLILENICQYLKEKDLEALMKV